MPLFRPLLFGGSLFGSPGGLGASPSAAGLMEALGAFLAADAQVAAAFAGGWANGAADRDTPFPYGVFLKANTERKTTFKGYSTEKVTVEFHALANSADSAEALARLVRARLVPTDTYTPTPLAFLDGREVGRYHPGGEVTVIDPELAPYNSDTWRSTVPIVFFVARGG